MPVLIFIEFSLVPADGTMGSVSPYIEKLCVVQGDQATRSTSRHLTRLCVIEDEGGL